MLILILLLLSLLLLLLQYTTSGIKFCNCISRNIIEEFLIELLFILLYWVDVELNGKSSNKFNNFVIFVIMISIFLLYDIAIIKVNLQLILNPIKLVQETNPVKAYSQSNKKELTKIAHQYQELKNLGAVNEVDKLVFKRSQTSCFSELLNNRVQMVWGPPGTGKVSTFLLLITN